MRRVSYISGTCASGPGMTGVAAKVKIIADMADTTHERVKPLALNLLEELGRCPAVSFHEGAVAICIQRLLQGMGLTAERDRYGNMIVHRLRPSHDGGVQPPIAFVAHMDHPGFEAVESSGDTLVARAWAGCHKRVFLKRSPSR